jgi:hypothetical protein
MGSVIKKRRKRMAKKKHKNFLRKPEFNVVTQSKFFTQLRFKQS